MNRVLGPAEESANNDKKLTKSFVESLNERGYYWDRDLKGFGVWVGKQVKTYFVQGRIEGKERRKTIGRHGLITTEDARKRALKSLSLMNDGIDPSEEAKAKREEQLTLQQLFDEYLQRKSLAPRTKSDYRSYLNRYFKDWAKKAITKITMDMAERRHQELGERHGPAQANVAFRCLRALYNYAEGVYTRKDGTPLITSNPTKRLSAKKQWFSSTRREEYIHETKFHHWFLAVNELRDQVPGSNLETVCDYLLLLAFTGFRRTEASLIKWECVDFEGRRIMLPRDNIKNDTNFSVPLTTFTYQLLKTRYENRQSDFVFPGKGKGGHIVEPRYAIEKIIKMSGVEFRPHDLRRTYASYASVVVDDNWTIKRLMNHLTGQDITQRYLQGVERLRIPAQKITDYFLKYSQPIEENE